MLRASRYYEARRYGLGDEFLDEIAVVVARIKANPEAVAPFGEGLRTRLLSRFPYALVYRTFGDKALMIAVAHNSRRSGYWKRRLVRS